MAAARLREWHPDDATTIAAILDDPHLSHWSSLPTLGPARWIDVERREARGPSRAICLPGDDRALGKVALRLPGRASPATESAALTDEDRPAGELSYWMLPEARGRGLASSAVQAMILHASTLGGIRSLVLDIEDDNAASLRLAQRLGAERREPTRIARDRQGVARTMVVHVIRLAPRAASSTC